MLQTTAPPPVSLRTRLAQIVSWLSPYSSFIVAGFFLLFLGIGFLIVPDYGINWDEEAHRYNANITYNFLVNGDRALYTFQSRYYGVAFEVPLLFLENWLNITEPRTIFLFRHYAIFSLFFISTIYFYKLAKLQLGHWLWALLATVMLILSPRIFGDAFHNNRDISVLSFFIISFYTLNRFLDKKTIAMAFWHGFACAILMNLRILGMIVPILTAFFLILDLIGKPTRQLSLPKTAGIFAFYLISTGAILIVTWPVLWEDPIGNFVAAYKNMKQYPWIGSMLFRGEMVTSDNLPWYYIPVWIAVTTPKLYIFAFAAGFILIAWTFLKNPLRALSVKQNHYDWAALAWFLAPLMAVIILKSIVYDGWRHLFFIYPALVLIAARCLQLAWQRIQHIHIPAAYTAGVLAFAVVLTLELISVTKFMIRFHPHQNVYFNRLTGESLGSMREHYEMDYWGLAYKQGLEYILKKDKSPQIKVLVANGPGISNSFILPKEERNRLKFVDNDNFDYFLSNYRWHPHDYNEAEKIHAIEVQGADIMGIYIWGDKRKN